MITQDLRIGIAGDTAIARGVAFQTEATSGMVVNWKTTDNPTSLLEENTIDILVEASSSTEASAQNAFATRDLPAGSTISQSSFATQIAPLSDDLVPATLLESSHDG